MKSSLIRKQFLDFFESKAHEIVTSAPMVIKNDPSLMFTNAGMNQFKEFFLGYTEPNSKRITDTQKCLRVSGKHNDLEEVGIDTYHHTFFEMLGNWSFGDYFKKEAIEWAWELLIDVYKIDPDRLYVTIFEGSAEEKLGKDTEAYNLWKVIIPEDRILLGSKKENFWEMGDQGPCGPCSEIHIDTRPKTEWNKAPGSALVNKDHPQVIELWNLVFIEFNRNANGVLEKLPKKHIDTGMGFERLCMVLQGKTSNYDTDIFTPIINEIEKITKNNYGVSQQVDIAIRVIADHIRTVFFAIADGQLPSNIGAGYVIRRILRRAIRYGFTFLDQKKPFIHLLVEIITKQLGDIFPELNREKQLAFNVIMEEEKSFLKTLDQGLVLLENVIGNLNGKKIPGERVFELYDTFGFPFDLTSLIANERGLDIDKDGFEKAMERQKSRSRGATFSKIGDWFIINDSETTEFIGYDKLDSKIMITRHRKMNTKKDGDFYQLTFDKTPFYPEGGGQIGDQGYLESENGETFNIIDTKKENNLIIHNCKSLPKKLDINLKAVVDYEFRQNTSSNHSATHLLHQALRSILGNHVEQKGSMVHPKMFRFDFSHFSKVNKDELKNIEEFVNQRILEKIPLEEQREVPYDKAIEGGAIALFGEKYGKSVRTIRFSESIELCGGTHVRNTSDIWYFKIISESAVASGVRRIEAITGEAVKSYFERQTQTLERINTILKHSQDPLNTIQNLQKENAFLKKEIHALSKLKLQTLKNNLINEITTISGTNFLSKEIEIDAQGMKDLSFEIGKDFDKIILVFGSRKTGKPLISCYISKILVNQEGRNAAETVNYLGKYISGSGGGQPFYATAGGKETKGLTLALDEAEKILFSDN
ncbi:MAG: alanine--tRNA ligase [Bacteroidota bacterium]|nr:alanine--tRNA ligase [Bacteroidota bacterium]